MHSLNILTAGRWLKHTETQPEPQPSIHLLPLFLRAVQGNNRSVSKSPANCFLIISLQYMTSPYRFKLIRCVWLIAFVIWNIGNSRCFANSSPVWDREWVNVRLWTWVSVAGGELIEVFRYSFLIPNVSEAHRLYAERKHQHGILHLIFSSRSTHGEVTVFVLLQFNILYQCTNWPRHHYSAQPRQNTAVIVTDNNTKMNQTPTDMQIHSFCHTHFLILPIISLTPFCHFTFTCAFLPSNALSLCLLRPFYPYTLHLPNGLYLFLNSF